MQYLDQLFFIFFNNNNYYYHKRFIILFSSFDSSDQIRFIDNQSSITYRLLSGILHFNNNRYY